MRPASAALGHRRDRVDQPVGAGRLDEMGGEAGIVAATNVVLSAPATSLHSRGRTPQRRLPTGGLQVEPYLRSQSFQ